MNIVNTSIGSPEQLRNLTGIYTSSLKPNIKCRSRFIFQSNMELFGA